MRLLTFKAFRQQIQQSFPSYWEEVEIHSINQTGIEHLNDLTILYTFDYDDDEYGNYLIEYEVSGCFYFHHDKIIGVGSTVVEAVEDHRVKCRENKKRIKGSTII